MAKKAAGRAARKGMVMKKKPACRIGHDKEYNVKKKPVARKTTSSNKGETIIKKKPAAYFMPVLHKKGKHLLYRRPAGRKSCALYTTSRPTRYVQKRNLKRPSGTGLLIPSISGRTLRTMCMRHGLLPRRRVCPRCGGELKVGRWEKELNMTGYRCKSRGCQWWISRIEGHPIFTTGRRAIAIQQQFIILRAFLNDIPSSSIHLQYNIPHATIERYVARIRTHITTWVKETQSEIRFTDDKNIPEVEVDECTVAKFPSGNRRAPMSWIGYIGLVRRGFPSSLVLEALPVKNTAARAPGPGPISSAVWQPIASRWLEHANLVMHTDSARAYKAPIAGVHHTTVIHQLKKIQGRWVPPTFSSTINIKTGKGCKKKFKSGTQTIDGFWAHLRRELRRRPSNRPEVVEEHVRMAQYKYWSSGSDPLEFFATTMPKVLE